ncbi:MAG TPA: hypothetical protein VGS59_06355 [Candidatus Acidoferrales bacterium]|nr:hypothetical protein [Candidatus Acidoferrales bacterium]
MRFPALAAGLLAAFAIAGCASTVSPLYSKTDAVTDPGILGSWVSTSQDNQGTVHVEKSKGDSYQITVHDPKSDDDTAYEAHLVKFGSASFADLLLTGYRHAGQDVDIPNGAVPLHQIVKYQITGDDLSVSVIDGDALEKAAKQPGFPLQLRGTKEGTDSQLAGDTVIISSTDDLRRYLSAHPADIFGEPSYFKRQH